MTDQNYFMNWHNDAQLDPPSELTVNHWRGCANCLTVFAPEPDADGASLDLSTCDACGKAAIVSPGLSSSLVGFGVAISVGDVPDFFGDLIAERAALAADAIGIAVPALKVARSIMKVAEAALLPYHDGVEFADVLAEMTGVVNDAVGCVAEGLTRSRTADASLTAIRAFVDASATAVIALESTQRQAKPKSGQPMTIAERARQRAFFAAEDLASKTFAATCFFDPEAAPGGVAWRTT